ncbi:hypothetical protein EMIT0P201_40018 [Pseudomonas chlororaphis]
MYEAGKPHASRISLESYRLSLFFASQINLSSETILYSLIRNIRIVVHLYLFRGNPLTSPYMSNKAIIFEVWFYLE